MKIIKEKLDYVTSYEGIASDGESFYFNGRLHVIKNNFNYERIPPFNISGIIPLSLLLQGYDHIGSSSHPHLFFQ